MAFKMKMKGFPRVTEGEAEKVSKASKAKSAFLPEQPPNEQEVANADQIAELRAKMKTVEPFSDEEEALRQQIIELRKPR